MFVKAQTYHDVADSRRAACDAIGDAVDWAYGAVPPRMRRKTIGRARAAASRQVNVLRSDAGAPSSSDPEHAVTGDIPEIVGNDRGLYIGDLRHYFRVLFFAANNLDDPYHNLRHMLHVTWLCYQACLYYRQQLTPGQIRNLLIAALFHDFDHPGQPHPGEVDPDGVNIALAIAALRRHVALEDRPFLPAIEALIDATHYPYTIDGAALDLPGLIIRDADLAQALSPAWIQQVVVGLARERRVEPLAILRQQPAFLAALAFNTKWARERFPPPLIAAKRAEAERLLSLLAS